MQQDNETIVQLIQTGQGDRKELLEQLWTGNLGLIRKIIHQLTGLERNARSDKEDFEDLEQQAFLGIMESVNKYDSDTGYKFFTFASFYIKKSIMQYYDKSGQAMRIPAYMRKRIKDYLSERKRLQESGKAYTSEIIQKNLGMSERATKETLRAIQRMEIERLDSYLNESDKESGTILDMIASQENTSESAMESSYHTELKELIRSVIKDLPEREREIIISRHFQGMNTKHIAKVLNCSYQNVSLLSIKAYKRMRTGKYAQELVSFLPERAIARAEKKVQEEFKELPKEERDLLL